MAEWVIGWLTTLMAITAMAQLLICMGRLPGWARIVAGVGAVTTIIGLVVLLTATDNGQGDNRYMDTPEQQRSDRAAYGANEGQPDQARRSGISWFAFRYMLRRE